MQRAMDVAEVVMLRLVALLLAFITIGVFIQVVLRYGASRSFLWGEELSVFAFIWCIFIGAAINVRRRTNFAFEFFSEALPGRLATLQRLLVDLIMLFICLILLKEGWAFAELSVKRLSPALGITLFIPTIIIPISAALMIFTILHDVVGGLKRLRDGT
jgi:TRAP-type C4-dicarboxylate transport system permease small subunit